ncbi:MAG: zinc ribbon domain-containing protein [Candidatus Methanoplasma sp.]|jgi:predicted nucleic acid-binding Zn ribbon protein|nr:zinc ribbon domain-containing protein [Candidatus Methanoplasma sp.]
MRYICPECGSEIPESSEFCYTCGRKRDNTIRLDESGRFVSPDKNMCASCNSELSPNDLFCQQCGEPISRMQMTMFRPKLVKYGWIGILLAIIPGAMGFVPGFFGIYGLGHFYFRRWARGATFIALSALMYYIRFGGFELSLWSNILLGIASTFFFFLQLMEVTVLAFMPHKTGE